jgi:KDO2-lipid IV(A) lauroyltransferase
VAAQGVSLRKRVRRELRVRGLLALLFLLRLLPYGFATALCERLGRLGYALSPRQRKLALRTLALAFPELPDGERARIARESFAHLGRSLAESVLADRIPVEELVELDPESEAVAREAVAQGKGVVVATGHIGNWELFARRSAALGLPIGTVAREAQDPRLTALLSRGRAGLRLFWRNSPMAGRELVRFLKQGGAVGILIDQDTKVAGHFVPFFGRDAFTPRAAGDLAARLRCPMIFGCCYRVAPRLHRMIVRPVDVARTGDAEADSLALTAAATKQIEEQIRARPFQWVWMHDRFRTERGVTPRET